VKLVLLNYEYPPLGGGAGNATACIARALVRQGHEIAVVTGAFGELRGTTSEGPQLTVTRLAALRRRADRSHYAEMLSFVASAAGFLPRFLRASSADGMIVFFSLPCGPLGWWADRRTGTPYVVSLRGSDVPGVEANLRFVHRLLSPFRRSALRGARAVVANSHGLARQSQAVDSVPTAVIPNGVDAEFFCPETVPQTAPQGVRFLYVGRLQSQKNLTVMLEQFAYARQRLAAIPLRLEIAGDGPQRAKLENCAEALAIANVVRWNGWLDKTALLAAYRHADIVLNPSFGEGMPNTVLEAMSCGIAVIASRVNGNDELVRHGETGLLFDINDASALGAAMIELAEAPRLRQQMGERARNIARARYSWDATAAQYAALFA
jgi:glycosyltransferase involved in cell wall biosynthesis